MLRDELRVLSRSDRLNFLGLPAELRNEIYDYILDGPHGPLHGISFALELPSPPRGPSEPQWDKISRHPLGRSQVCRLIRKEFLPMHTADKPITTSRTHLHMYLEPTASPTVSREHAVGNIIFRVSPLRLIDGNYFPKVNVLPLLELCAVAPHFKAIFDGGMGPQRHVVGLKWTATWQDMAETKARELVVGNDGARIHLDVVAKRKHVKAWDKSVTTVKVKDDIIDDLAAWMDSFGHDAFMSHVKMRTIHET